MQFLNIVVFANCLDPVYKFCLNLASVQLAGAVEYANYISIEGWDSYQLSVLDMTLNHLMVRF